MDHRYGEKRGRFVRSFFEPDQRVVAQLGCGDAQLTHDRTPVRVTQIEVDQQGVVIV